MGCDTVDGRSPPPEGKPSRRRRCAGEALRTGTDQYAVWADVALEWARSASVSGVKMNTPYPASTDAWEGVATASRDFHTFHTSSGPEVDEHVVAAHALAGADRPAPPPALEALIDLRAVSAVVEEASGCALILAGGTVVTVTEPYRDVLAALAGTVAG